VEGVVPEPRKASSFEAGRRRRAESSVPPSHLPRESRFGDSQVSSDAHPESVDEGSDGESGDEDGQQRGDEDNLRFGRVKREESERTREKISKSSDRIGIYGRNTYRIPRNLNAARPPG